MKMPAAPYEATSSTPPPRIPTKAELCLVLILRAGDKGINKHEAQRDYGDTCLNTTISELSNGHGLIINRVREKHHHRYGGTVIFMRYSLPPISIEKAIALLKKLRGARQR